MVKIICPNCNSEMKEIHDGKKTYWVCEKCGYIVKPKKKKEKAKRKKMSKEEMIEKFKELAEQYNIPTDNIDFEAIVDSELTFEENRERIIEEFRKYNPDIEREIDLEKMERDFREHYRKMIIEEFNRDIEQIKQRKTPELDRYFGVVKELVKIVVNGNATGLVIYGEAGLGKTYTILQTLAECGKKLGEDYIYISTHITPLELVNLLYKYQDRIIVLDDVEKLLLDEKTIGILKSALWSSVGKRIITYYTTSEKLEAPEEFEFRGKVILMLNKIPKRNKEIIESLLSRVLTYKLDFSYEERLKIMYEMAKILKIPLEVVDFLKSKFTPALKNFNFRTLIQLNIIKQYYNENENWKNVAEKLLEQNIDRKMKVVWELMNSNLSVKEQVERFREMTGMSRRTYFRIKARIENLMGNFGNNF